MVTKETNRTKPIPSTVSLNSKHGETDKSKHLDIELDKVNAELCRGIEREEGVLLDGLEPAVGRLQHVHAAASMPDHRELGRLQRRLDGSPVPTIEGRGGGEEGLVGYMVEGGYV